MLHESFRKQLKDSASAPVMVNGANIGMVRCSRAVLVNVRVLHLYFVRLPLVDVLWPHSGF